MIRFSKAPSAPHRAFSEEPFAGADRKDGGVAPEYERILAVADKASEPLARAIVRAGNRFIQMLPLEVNSAVDVDLAAYEKLLSDTFKNALAGVVENAADVAIDYLPERPVLALSESMQFAGPKHMPAGSPHGGEFAPGGGSGGTGSGSGGSEAGGTGEKRVTLKTADEARTYLKDTYGDWRQKLTPAQDTALAFYQSPGYELMNGQLRGEKVNAKPNDLTRAKKATADLTKAIDAAPPLKDHLTVFRGFNMEQFGGSLTKGQIIADKGFVSTSLTREQAGQFNTRGTPAMATITLPKGTKAAGGSVKELILAPNTHFVVTGVTKRGKNTEVSLELHTGSR